MSWDQLRELTAGGVTIGSQTASHPHMPRLSPAQNREQLSKSNARFQAELNMTPALFAYPYGEYGMDIEGLVAEMGFRAAFGQHSGVAYAGHDKYALPRWAMNENYGDLKRFRLAANALPFRVRDVTPADNILKRNPPAFGFTVADDLPSLKTMNCYSSHHGGPLHIERLGAKRIELRLKGPFPPGRGRINCTMLGPDRRWRWFGTQFYIPRQ
jgi:peptidoglycan/xylan/chitin deacetylase (PgdA/CDA1 family)